jgi:hypothetical protein
VDSVKRLKEPLAQNVETLVNELDSNKDTIDGSQDHVRRLKYEADNLDNMLGKTRIVSENAVAAATAYKKIETALKEALIAADQAKDSANRANEIVWFC